MIELAVPLITGRRDIHITVSCFRPLKISSQPSPLQSSLWQPIFDERVIDACVAEFAVFAKLLYSNLACLLHIYIYFVFKSIVPQRSDGSDLFLLFIYFFGSDTE